MIKKILISGGKTGGHLIPGIALYEEIHSRGIKTPYVMSAFDLKFTIVSRVAESDRILLNLQNISRKLTWKTPLYILKILKAFFEVFFIIRKENPDAVLITGGYISNPVALSAILLRKPLYIAEQNSVAGITNRFYSRFSRTVFTSFPVTEKIPLNKSILTGNPSIFRDRTPKTEALKYFGLENYNIVIGVTGGSQGARKVNEAFRNLMPYLKEKNIGVIWSTGPLDYPRLEKDGVLKSISSDYPNVKFYPFIDRMDLLFSGCSLIMNRSGATSISEMIHYEIPALLIPIYHSPDDHQLKNAEFLQESNAARIVTEDQLDKLQEVLDEMLNNPGPYQTGMKNLNSKLFKTPPEKKIADVILAI